MTKLTLILCLFFAAAGLLAQPVLVKNIQPGLSSGILLGLTQSTLVDNTLYFSAWNGVNGTELWKSDGTEAGTVMVRDVYPGNTDGFEKMFAAFDHQLYFTGRDAEHGTELWRTDNGPDGAVLLTDACPGQCVGALYNQPGPMAVFQDKLYFRSAAAGLGHELWVTDGTPGNVNLVKDIDPDGSDSNPYLLTPFQGKLYFVCDSSNWGRELWVTDGTQAGTRPVKNINPTLSFSLGDSGIDGLVPGPDALYFWAKSDDASGKELWKSDGTEAGTAMVKDIRPGSGNGASGKPLTNSVWLGNHLIFVANDGNTGEELWITDGTEAGTMLLADINPGSSGSGIQILTEINGSVFFKANNGSNGIELWITDGTTNGTHLLKDINPGAGSGLGSYTIDFCVFQNKLLFEGYENEHGSELWISDGTTDGTYLFYDIDPGAAESSPDGFHVSGATLLFFAQTAPTGRELWKLDLSAVAVQEPKQTLHFALNPTVSNTGLFNLVIEQGAAAPELLKLEVCDLTGRIFAVQTLAGGSQTVDLTPLPPGAYVVWLSGMKTRQRGTKRVFIMP